MPVLHHNQLYLFLWLTEFRNLRKSFSRRLILLCIKLRRVKLTLRLNTSIRHKYNSFPLSFPILNIVFPTKITILRQVFLPAPGYGSESVAQPANQVKRHRHHNCHQLTSIVWVALIFIANSSYEGFFLRRNLNFHHRWLTVGSECQTSQISVSFKSSQWSFKSDED